MKPGSEAERALVALGKLAQAVLDGRVEIRQTNPRTGLKQIVVRDVQDDEAIAVPKLPPLPILE